ncbi:unnamed protein product [Schistosoma turkestanicum]|nr:unnamed protein product [Schistosoma turkestanicum]
MTASLFQWFKFHKIHGYFYVVVLTYSWVALCMYWLFILLDPSIFTCNTEIKNIPLWFIHMSNLLIPVVIVTEALIWVPRTVNILISILICCTLALIYNIYVEIQIIRFQHSIYPHLDKLRVSHRYMIYFVGWLWIIIFTFISCLLVRSLNPRDRLQCFQTKVNKKIS